MIPELLHILSSVPSPLVILGDFNVHHTSWGSHHCDSVSHHFLHLFDSLNLCVLNDGSPTRRVSFSQNPSSAVDISVSSSSLSSRLSWRVLPYSFGSDHFPVLLSFPDPVPSISFSPRFKYQTAKADWPMYSLLLDNEIARIYDHGNEDAAARYNKFKNAIILAANGSIPQKRQCPRKTPYPPWWDSECSEAVGKRKSAEQLLTLNFSRENYDNYLKIADDCSKFLLVKKQKGWQSFCESLSPSTSSSSVWRKLNRFRGAFASESKVQSNDPSEWVEPFADKLAPPSVPILEEVSPVLPSLQSTSNNQFDEPFSYEEFLTAISHLKDSSPGYVWVMRVTRYYYVNVVLRIRRCVNVDWMRVI
ncbi:uncharacterized protein LOC125231054 [Leguminivora glycinivorella]|uniref:uncharacterized protein LOC125231054 n=1 Tax=Leguminivora glycinivorella TaxID=1035111 RepID=UPI00200D2EE6|nr:uncharacterized protein LOC125231054 [Leguminivora glycinivorella]